MINQLLQRENLHINIFRTSIGKPIPNCILSPPMQWMIITSHHTTNKQSPRERMRRKRRAPYPYQTHWEPTCGSQNPCPTWKSNPPRARVTSYRLERHLGTIIEETTPELEYLLNFLHESIWLMMFLQELLQLKPLCGSIR